MSFAQILCITYMHKHTLIILDICSTRIWVNRSPLMRAYAAPSHCDISESTKRWPQNELCEKPEKTTHQFWSLVSPRPWSSAYHRPSSFRVNPVHVRRQFINDVSFKKVIDSWFVCVLPSEKRSHSCEMLGGQDGWSRAWTTETGWACDGDGA